LRDPHFWRICVVNLSQVVEALLISAQKPLTARELVAAIKGAGAEDELSPNEFAKTSEAQVSAALEQLKIEYIEEQRAFQLLEKAEGWQLASDPQYARWVKQLFPAAKTARLTPPALETLAIIAYRQPVTRGDIEEVRGVTVSSQIIQTLEARGWIDAVGHRETPGRPALYATTRKFLDDLGLRSLEELPPLEEIAQTLSLESVRTAEAGVRPANAETVAEPELEVPAATGTEG
jgi:segregation and condensation protein B